MAKNTLANHLPRRAEQNLQIVGEQIRLARLRRDLSIVHIAKRASCSVLTVMRVEKGAPTVAIGIYLRILLALGLDESILFIAKYDEMGRTLQDLDLKHRQRASKITHTPKNNNFATSSIDNNQSV
jgi:transcriptional regulator with XRE-family HTH domain